MLGPRQRGREVKITLDGQSLRAEEGEPIAAALWASDIRVLRWTPQRGEPRGVFCALGRCTDCVMTVDGQPNVRTCMTPVREGMRLSRPRGCGTVGFVPDTAQNPAASHCGAWRGEEWEAPPQVAVVGAGPAGLCAAATAAELGARVAVYDENDRPGGQLFKQIHRFFGSQEHYAGVRGCEIGRQLVERARAAGVQVRLGTTVFGIFDGLRLGLYMPGQPVRYVQPERLVLAVGATERGMPFAGWTLPGVMGAGAAQTLMNIHRVLPGRRALMVGSGNVGLIVSYQLLQAGAHVVAVVESAPQVGGYAVHAAKLLRQGVPLLLSHTVVAAHGEEAVRAATVARLGEDGRPVAGTERCLEVDLICLAVGLTPQIELAQMAGCALDWDAARGGHVVRCDENRRTSVPPVYVAGDVSGIEEASTAMEEGTLAGISVAHSLGLVADAEAHRLRAQCRKRLEALRAASPRPGKATSSCAARRPEVPSPSAGGSNCPGPAPTGTSFPPPHKPLAVIECPQPIPCNPCETACPQGAIRVGDDITALPVLDENRCTGCGLCVRQCPGLAIFVVGPGRNDEEATVMLPHELPDTPGVGEAVQVLDRCGQVVAQAEVVRVQKGRRPGDTALVTLAVPRDLAHTVRAFRRDSP